MGPAHYTKGFQRFSSAQISRGPPHWGGPRAGFGYGAGSTDTSAKGDVEGALLPADSQGFTAVASLFQKRMSHPHSQEVPEVCFRGQSIPVSGSSILPSLNITPHFTKCVDAALAPLRLQGIRVLYYISDLLILAQSEQMAVRHRDVVLSHIKMLGLRLNAKKSVLLPALRTTFLGVIWDSTTMRVRLSPARISVILTAVNGVKLGQSLTVKQFLTVGSHGSCVQRNYFWPLLYMRTLQ